MLGSVHAFGGPGPRSEYFQRRCAHRPHVAILSPSRATELPRDLEKAEDVPDRTDSVKSLLSSGMRAGPVEGLMALVDILKSDPARRQLADMAHEAAVEVGNALDGKNVRNRKSADSKAIVLSVSSDDIELIESLSKGVREGMEVDIEQHASSSGDLGPLVFSIRNETDALMKSLPPNIFAQALAQPIFGGGDAMGTPAFSNLLQIGKGSFSKIYSAALVGEEEAVALKVISLEDWPSVRGELLVSRLPSHPHVARVLWSGIVDYPGFSIDGGSGSCWLVMQRHACNARELCDAMRLCSDSATFSRAAYKECVRTILNDALMGMCHIHGEGLVHHDVKARNILVRITGSRRELMGYCSMSDFGETVKSPGKDDQPLTQRKGTLAYLAPEVRLGLPHGQPCDAWSFGILCLELAYCDGRTVERLDAIKKMTFPKSLSRADGENLFEEPMEALLKRPLFNPAQDESEKESVYDHELLGIVRDLCRADPCSRTSLTELLAREQSYFTAADSSHRSLLAAVTRACGFADAEGRPRSSAASEFITKVL